MILHSLTDKSCKILQSPSQKVMQDLSGMISPDIVPKSVVILHTKSCKIIEVFNPRSYCLCDLTGIILTHLSRLFRHDLSGYSSKIHCDLARSWILLLQDLARIFSWEPYIFNNCFALAIINWNQKQLDPLGGGVHIHISADLLHYEMQ